RTRGVVDLASDNLTRAEQGPCPVSPCTHVVESLAQQEDSAKRPPGVSNRNKNLGQVVRRRLAALAVRNLDGRIPSGGYRVVEAERPCQRDCNVAQKSRARGRGRGKECERDLEVCHAVPEGRRPLSLLGGGEAVRHAPLGTRQRRAAMVVVCHRCRVLA